LKGVEKVEEKDWFCSNCGEPLYVETDLIPEPHCVSCGLTKSGEETPKHKNCGDCKHIEVTAITTHWRIVEAGFQGLEIRSGEKIIAEIPYNYPDEPTFGEKCINREKALAKARLIRIAPEMFEALVEARKCISYSTNEDCEVVIDRIDKIISEVEG